MWTHGAVGAIALFVYLYTRLGHLPWWTPFASLRLILIGAPVLLPYAISAANCWRLYTWQGGGPGRLRAAAFVAVLLAAAVLVNATLFGAFGHVERLVFFELLGAQTWAYLWGASWILDVI